MTALVSSLGAYVEAFEEARSRRDAAPIENFLPESGHPLRSAVLLELVRIDLEHGWLAGRPTPLETYSRRFPDLFADPVALREILFEDYRLRMEVARLPGSPTGNGVKPAGATTPAIGSTFAGFRLLAELGRGSFGRVFLAEQ